MTTENVDIVVSDKGTKVVKRNIDDIAKSAENADGSLQGLKDILQGLQGATAALNAVSNDLKILTAASASAVSTQKALENAVGGAVTEMLKAVDAQQSLAKSVDDVNAKISTTSKNLEYFDSHMQVFQNFKKEQADAAKASEELQARVTALKGSVDPFGLAIEKANAELAEAKSLYSQNAISMGQLSQAEAVLTQRVVTLAAAQAKANDLHTKAGKAAGLEAYEMLNLGRQASDVFTTLAMGMNPLMVLIQQGPQIADVFENAKTRGVGFGAALKSIAVQLGLLKVVQTEANAATAQAAVVNGTAATSAVALSVANDSVAASATTAAAAESVMLAPLAVILAAITASIIVMATGFALAAHNMNQGSQTIAAGLDLSQKQMDNLKKKGVDLKVSLGDSFKGFFVTVGQELKENFGGAFDWLESAWNAVLAFLTKAFVGTIKVIVGGIAGMVAFFGAAFNDIPSLIGDAFYSGVNAAVKAINWLDDRVVDFLKTLGSDAQRAHLAEVANPFSGSMQSSMETGAKAFESAYDKAGDAVDAFGAKWKKNSEEIAKKRILAAAGGTTKTNGFDSTKELANVNRELDNQLARTSMLTQQAEVQQKVDAITQKFAEHGVTLDKETVNGLRAKIEAIQDATRVQGQMNAIYDEFNKPAQDFNDTVTAANKLLADGTITQEQYNQAFNAAYYSYKQATDPLMSYNQALDDQIATFGQLGDQLAKTNYIQGIQHDLEAKGKSLYDSTTGALTAEAKALLAKYDLTVQQARVQSQLNDIYSDTQGQLDQLTAKEQALTMAKQKGLISTDAYNAQLVQTQIAMAQVRTEAGNSDAMDVWVASLSNVMNGFKSTASSVSNIIGDTFSQLVDGVSDSVAKAIVEGDNLRESLANVAKTILEQLISSLIKLGVQYVINATLGETIAAGLTAANVALAATTAAAWAPAAAAVSLATLGANAVPAVAGMATAYASSSTMAAFAGAFDSGGQFMVDGKSGVDKNLVSMALSQGERVTVETPYQQRMADASNSSGGNTAQQHAVDVTANVGVTVDDDGNLKAYVKSVSQQTSISVTRQGLDQYDKALPNRVKQINDKPRQRRV